MKTKQSSYYTVASGILLLTTAMVLSSVSPKIGCNSAFAETKSDTQIKKNSYTSSEISGKPIQLFPNVSEKNKELLNQKLNTLLGDQKIKTFFYVTKNSKKTTLSSTDVGDLVNIDIITDKDKHLSIPVNILSGDKVSLFSDGLIVDSSELIKTNEENVTYLSDFIKSTSIEELEASYGGPMTYQKMFNGDTSYSLKNVQIGDQREIDGFQLSDKYKEIQNNSLEVANFIVSSFPELQNKIELEKNIKELVFTYTYLHKWYDYSIGGVNVGDIMFSKQTMFSKTNNITNYEHLISFTQKLKSQPWAASNPGMPYAYSGFTTFPLFEGTDSLRNEGKGFDSDDLLNSEGKVYMSSIIEYLVRTLENTEDYNAWFDRQGFVTATSYLPDGLGASKTGQSLWEALKSLEKNTGNRLSKGFITNLLSVSDRSKISISNSAKGLYFSNTTKQLTSTTESPKELAKKYADNNNNFFRFILQTGTEKQKNLLNDVLLNKSYWYTMDTGEIESGKKDFYNKDNVYLNQFIMSADIKGANTISDPGLNGVCKTVNGNSAIYMSLNSLNSELTISHEETHRMQSILNSGYNLRGSMEVTAIISECSNNAGTDYVAVNYFYGNSKFGDWNREVPKNTNELKSYTKNMMDLNYAWNIEKANIIFSKQTEEQVGKVYQSSYDKQSKSLVIKKLTKNELEKLNIHSTDSDFIDELIKNKIVLPADTSKQEISYDLSSWYATIPFKRDSIFSFETSGSGDFKESNNYVNGFANLWGMEFMGNDGLQGYVDFYTDHLGSNDEDVINKKFGENADSYMSKRYKEVSSKLEKNLLKDYDSNSFRKLVENNISNDRKARQDFLVQEIANHNNLFESIYKDSIVGGDITVKYTNMNNQEIAEPTILKGNVGDNYTSKEKSIAGYTVKEIQGNATGKFTDKPQTINYIYKRLSAANVTIKYLDESGKSIHANQIISGNIGDAFDTSTSKYQLIISGYSLDKGKLPSNIKGCLSDKPQTIIYRYKKNITPINYVKIFRLYNKNTGEHLYTTSGYERDELVKGGWSSEGTGWLAPQEGTPVYRLYNPNAKGGDHYYTNSKFEAESLVKTGWKWDNDGKAIFYSGGKTPIYVAYNPNAQSGSHNYTQSSYEQKMLLNNGWKFGSIAFYGK